LQEQTKKKNLNLSTHSSSKSFLKLKSTWLVIIGALLMMLSPYFDWMTATVTVPPPIPFNHQITMTGYDATWNLTFGPIVILRMICFQLAALAFASLALLLKTFPHLEAPKRIRGTLLLISGVLAAIAPIYFINTSISKAQELVSSLTTILTSLGVRLITELFKPQYNISAGPGLILAILGSVLLLVSGLYTLRERD
jgi:hypothetical protein